MILYFNYLLFFAWIYYPNDYIIQKVNGLVDVLKMCLKIDDSDDSDDVVKFVGGQISD